MTAPPVRSGSPRLQADVGRGVTLSYQEFGNPEHPPIVLIAGLGQQMHCWRPGLICALLEHGFRIVRFDNRDVGGSTHMEYPAPNPVAMLRGGNHSRQYHLGDMARDTVGLLDAIGSRDAHVVGMSMGAMIAQTVAAHYPDRVRSLTSIMSNTGAPGVGRPAPSTWLRMATTRPARSAQQFADQQVRMFRHIGSRGKWFDEAWIREYASIAWDQDQTSAGVPRQLAAIFASGDRTSEVQTISATTLVIHGDCDPMVHPSGGVATARAIPGARLESIAGMGHDLPRQAWPRLVDLIGLHCAAAERV